MSRLGKKDRETKREAKKEKESKQLIASVDRVVKAKKSSVKQQQTLTNVLDSFNIARDTRYEILFDLKQQWIECTQPILKNEMGTQIIILADKIIATDGRLADIGILSDLKALDDNDTAIMQRWADIFNKGKVEK